MAAFTGNSPVSDRGIVTPQAGGAAGGGGFGQAAGDFLTEDGMPSFHDIRAESEMVRQRINHAKLMAERAIRRGDYSVSQYYVDEVSGRIGFFCRKECICL